MKTAFFDCYSGISGDMCLGALIDAGVPLARIRAELDKLPVSDWEIRSEKVVKGGISATKVHVAFEPSQHPLRTLPDILELIRSADIPSGASEIAVRIFKTLARAEAAVHNCAVEDVHFHEVGALDSIIDITGGALAFYELGIEKVMVSEIALGYGEVETMHGRLPIPAPATSRLLRGFRVKQGPVERELTTPTGAAILRGLAANTLSSPPAMRLEKTGYGAGSADLEGRSNTLRVMIGEVEEPVTVHSDEETIWMVETNIDDMTGEEVGFLLEQSFERGALDVFITPIQMKKNRPAFCFTVLCYTEKRRDIINHILEDSSTLGVRYWPAQRCKLDREIKKVQTKWGTVDVKVSTQSGRQIKFKPEFQQCRRISETQGISLKDVYKEVDNAYENAYEGDK